MGLCEFYIEEEGKTPAEAFIKAVGKACEIYVEDSHTGSIAEKTNFQVINDSIADITNQLADKTTKLHKLSRTPSIIKEDRLNIEIEYKWLNREYRAFKSRSKKTGHNKAVAIAYALIVLQDDRINSADKPAGAIQYIKDHWLFFGMTEE